MGLLSWARIATVVLALVVTGVLPHRGWGQEAANRIGTVLVVEGTAEVRAQDATEWERVRFRDAIFLNDTVRTAEDSKLKVLLRDDTIMTLGERSEMQFTDFLLSQQQRRTVVNLFIGKLRVITTRIFGLGSATEVQMPNAVAGIRGSDVICHVESPSNTSVTTVSTDTEVTMQNPNFPQQTRQVPTGTQSQVTGNTPATESTPVSNTDMQGLMQGVSTAAAQVPSEVNPTDQPAPTEPPRGDQTAALPPPPTQALPSPPPTTPTETGGLEQLEQQQNIQQSQEQQLEHITETTTPDSGNQATEETIRNTLVQFKLIIPR